MCVSTSRTMGLYVNSVHDYTLTTIIYFILGAGLRIRNLKKYGSGSKVKFLFCHIISTRIVSTLSFKQPKRLALRRWDEAARPEVTRENKKSLGDKIVSMFNLRRRNTVKESAQEKSKASVRRSQSMVTQNRKKLGEYQT